MKKIVITGEKGGTGKSTVTALSLEYINYLNKKAKLTDLDPLQISTSYVQNCQEENRK
jgi:cellulose biosynthesis protein BcsQ